MSRRRIGSLATLLLVGLVLSACTMGYGERLDPSLVRSMRLERVDVSVAPDATFYWGDGERAYARSIGKPDFEAEAAGATPAGRTYMKSLASQRIKAAFDRELAGRLGGGRPVRVVVVMRHIFVSSPLQRILIGGNYTMKATANLVDARTGAVLAENPNLSVSVPAGQGIAGTIIDPAFGEPIDRLSNNLADSYRSWLQPG